MGTPPSHGHPSLLWGTSSVSGTLLAVGTHPCHGDNFQHGDHGYLGDPSLPWGTPSLPWGSPSTSGTLPATEISPGTPSGTAPPGVSSRSPPARPVGSPVSPPGRDRPRDSPIFFKALPGRRGPPEPSDGERGCSAAGRAFLPQIIVRGRCPGTPGTPGSPGSPGAPGPDGAPGRCSRAGRRRRTGLGLAWGWAAPSGPGPGAGKYREEPRFSPDGVNCLCPPGPRGGCR